MLGLALRNLLVRKARTALALLGLTIAIVGIIGLISVSSGIQALVHETLSMVPGLTILEKDVISLSFSSLPKSAEAKIEGTPGVHAVVAQVWYPAFEVEGEKLILKGDPFNMFLVLGVGEGTGRGFRDKGPILGKLREGRGVHEAAPGEEPRPEVLIPLAAARRFGKKVGDRLHVQGRDLEVVGIFHSGSLFFDRCLVVPLAIARAIAGKGPELVSAYYAELEPGADAAAVARRVEARVPGTNAWTSDAVTEETAQVWDEVDLFLSAIASIAVLVGAVGIVNTMLMSVIERTGELGVLRATGWTRRDVVRLILVESAALGVLGGVLGCGLGAALVAVAGALLPLRPVVTPGLAAASFGLAVALGVLGGLYPAWRAARLDPIEAIRT